MAEDTVLDEVVVTPPAIQNSHPVARQPRGIVKINGDIVRGWADFSATNNTYFEADTFHVTYVASELGKQTYPIGDGAVTYDLDYFSSISNDTFVEIFAGFPSNPANPKASELASLVYGRIDDVEYNARAGTITLTGRDLSGALIDSKVPRTYLNKTASFIAADIANQLGLTSMVTATTGNVGSPSQNADAELLHDSGSDWDLLAGLARNAGFVLFVSGKTLFFQPDTSANSDPYIIQWTPSKGGPPSANVAELSLSRSLTITKGIVVTAQSSGLTSKQSVSRSYPTSARAITPGKAVPYGAATVYIITLPPGRTASQVQKAAEDAYKRITAHAMKLKADLPGDGILNARGLVKLKGTGTDFDQNYFVRSVVRSLSKESGYRMSVEAQNTTPTLAAAT